MEIFTMPFRGNRFAAANLPIFDGDEFRVVTVASEPLKAAIFAGGKKPASPEGDELDEEIECYVPDALLRKGDENTVRNEAERGYRVRPYTVARWPQSQDLKDAEGFAENSNPVDDETGIRLFGPSAYRVNPGWLKKNGTKTK